MSISRRTVLKGLGASGALAIPGGFAVAGQASALRVAGRAVEATVTPIDHRIVRISVVPLEAGRAQPIADDGSLVRPDWGEPLVPPGRTGPAPVGHARGGLAADGLVRAARVPRRGTDGRLIQQIRVDGETGAFTFHLGDGPVLGFGEGGQQFDRRGSADRMRSGQGGYRLRTHGGRVPVPWLIGTSGWAMFVHHPAGRFDLTGAEGSFTPAGPSSALPIDLFIVTARDPSQVMAEYARLTGHPEMPPLWALGYQQSHRTLASREEVLSIARTFREKKLPCDALIYLGTGFCPSGWNTGHGSFTFNPRFSTSPRPFSTSCTRCISTSCLTW